MMKQLDERLLWINLSKCEPKKGFSGEAFVLLCANGAPFSYAHMIRGPDSIVKCITSFVSAGNAQTGELH